MLIDALIWLEETRFSTWMRESGPAFFSSLVLHSIAMGFVVGVQLATNLRILGVAPGVPLSLMRRFFPALWMGLAVVTVSGVLLMAAYPTKALTNEVFYLKLVAIAVALLITRRVTRDLLDRPVHDAGPVPAGARGLAALSLALWVGAVTAGRLLAYTADVLMASHLRY